MAETITSFDPARYEAWYHTARGRWIANREFDLLWRLLRPGAGESLLDVGCGTGHFSRRFARAGLTVTGLDPDPAMLAFAREHDGTIAYLQGRAEALPFADDAFDYCVAVTSLCFVANPARALAEMWRVARRGVALGLLHRPSWLWWRKRRAGSYRGARWDTWREVQGWIRTLAPAPRRVVHGYGIFGSGASVVGRRLEERLPLARLPLGGFLALALHRTEA